MSDQAQFELGVTLPVAKARDAEREDGDLIIEGIAADYDVDRENEAFLPGAFDSAIEKYLSAGGPLVYHHDTSQQLGQVLELSPGPEGLAIKAVVPRPTDGSPLLDVYNKIKRGMIRGLSLSGRALKKMTEAGPRIAQIDIAETSVTPVPMGPRALFAVAQKAFPGEFAEELEDADAVREWFTDRFGEIEERIETVSKAAETAKREEWAKKGIAMSDGSFPITHCGTDSYSNGAARSRLGSTDKDRDTVLAHIRKREQALGCSGD